jgi:zinc transport system permease protein
MIEVWYRFIAFLLPFEWAKQDQMFFMKNALLAVLLVAPLLGTLSTMIVSKRMAFFSDALGHGAFTGIVIGSIFGLQADLGSAVLFSIFFSIVITVVRNKSKMSSDTIIGVFSSTAVALGIFISTQGGHSFTKLNRILIGDLLSITPGEIELIFVILLITTLVWLLFYNRMLVVSVNLSYADSLGIQTLPVELIFTVLVAVIVTISIPWIGLLTINSLLVLPGASARNIARNSRKYHFWSVLFSLVSGLGGLMISYCLGTATGATIVLFSVCIFLFTLIINRSL